MEPQNVDICQRTSLRADVPSLEDRGYLSFEPTGDAVVLRLQERPHNLSPLMTEFSVPLDKLEYALAWCRARREHLEAANAGG